MMAGVRAARGTITVSSGPREEFLDAVESVSRGIRDPAAKLLFIRRSLDRYRGIDRVLRIVPSESLRRWLYGRLSLESLRDLLKEEGLGAAATMAPGTRVALAVNRVLAITAGLSLATLVLVVGYGVFLARPATPPVLAATAPALEASVAPSLAPVAETLPPLGGAVHPARAWLVETGAGYEQYSNGLRIDTTFAISGEPRRFRTYTLAGPQEETLSRPVGILFHTSESDIWPLEEDFNAHLKTSSHGLLRYVQRLHLYNYLIDRFGRTFRIVEETAKANHAGHSIWEDDGRFYLSLNHAFLGICFESRWEGGQALPITSAQLAAGRSLTEYLRQRWSIPGEMCVSHGLTSVNPHRHLVGEHLDWARGFPFEAFGLPNQYTHPAPSVAAFGFGYDDGLLKVLGEPWPGILEAERSLEGDARSQGKTVSELRRERQNLYDRWLSDQARDEEAWTSSRADRAPTRGLQGG